MKVAICGDILLRDPESKKIGKSLQARLRDCDVRCLNFEVPIYTDGAVGIHKSGPVHSQSPFSIDWLVANGFDLVTLANNHALDYGQQGLKNTIARLSDIKITGVGTYNSAYKPTIIESEGERIGFLGLTHKEWGCVNSRSADNLGTASITSPKAYESIIENRDKVDRLYILAHAGVEHIEIPLPEWRELYRMFINLGASGVIASHPHVPQGYEIYRDCPIVYSLGNLLFEINRPELKEINWFRSLLAIIDTCDNSLEVIPLLYDYKTGVVEIDSSDETEKYIEHLNNLLHDSNYEDALQAAVESQKLPYRNLMISGGAYRDTLKNRIKELIKPLFGKKRRKIDKIHLLNVFQCESHRWMIIRILENIIDKQHKV